MTTVDAKHRAEVEALKASWLRDPCWDIEDTEGFEAFRDELKAFSDEHTAKRAAAAETRRARWEAAGRFEIDDLDEMLGISSGNEDWADSTRNRVGVALIHRLDRLTVQMQRIADALERR